MEKKSKKKSEYLAVVRVRGKINLDSNLKRTFEQLNLHNKNWCVVVKDTPTNKGMIKKVKDYITYGEISSEVFDELLKNRGEISNNEKSITFNKKKYKRYFRLSPPKKGYGRKGIKVSFQSGGALGYRKNKINDLLKRMI
jgi:large subunit ribosomal protein L30